MYYFGVYRVPTFAPRVCFIVNKERVSARVGFRKFNVIHNLTGAPLDYLEGVFFFDKEIQGVTIDLRVPTSCPLTYQTVGDN